jgi:hypothetical protein
MAHVLVGRVSVSRTTSSLGSVLWRNPRRLRTIVGPDFYCTIFDILDAPQRDRLPGSGGLNQRVQRLLGRSNIVLQDARPEAAAVDRKNSKVLATTVAAVVLLEVPL